MANILCPSTKRFKSLQQTINLKHTAQKRKKKKVIVVWHLHNQLTSVNQSREKEIPMFLLFGENNLGGILYPWRLCANFNCITYQNTKGGRRMYTKWKKNKNWHGPRNCVASPFIPFSTFFSFFSHFIHCSKFKENEPTSKQFEGP